MRKSLSCLFIVGMLLVALPLAAHHSLTAEFDTNKPVSFTGTVKKVDWMNPHIYTHVEVKQPNGSTIEYRVEGGPPNALYRNGWRPDTLKPGETVSVTGLRAKSETSINVGQATIKKADGTAVFGGR
jgi:DNA/RNA endonuclease YhcR with UshA esterase domain